MDNYTQLVFTQFREGWEIVRPFLVNYWWLVAPILLTLASIEAWLYYVQGRWARNQKYVFLAINVPSIEDKSPKGMENIIASLSAIPGGGNWSEQFWLGRSPATLSLEMVSVGGAIRFIIMVGAGMKDWLEATIYAQYPDAEIAEVEDYAQVIPNDLLYAEFDWFATELKLTKADVYPIKSYVDFEHSHTGEMVDPISALTEVFSNLTPTEQMWIQIVITNAGGDWRKTGLKEVNKLMKREKKEKKPFFPEIPILSELFKDLVDIVKVSPSAAFGVPEFGGADAKKEAFEKVEFLSPGERTTLEALERSITKPAFTSKIRAIYLAPKDAFNPKDRVTALFSIFNQYNSQDLNSFAPNKTTTTKVDYFFPTPRVEGRKRRVMHWYRHRDIHEGGKNYVLSAEELATVFHFPSEVVVAPKLQRPEAKRATAPANLPVVPDEE